MNATLVQFVIARLRSEAEDALDDPSNFTRRDEFGDDIRVWIREMRTVATEVGADFDHLLSTLGTKFERDRLQRIIMEVK